MLIKPLDVLWNEDKPAVDMSFLGVVEDNEDPKKLGRVRVVIPPYDGMVTEDLPWACPLLPSYGNSPEAGGLNIPEVGSQVRITFPSKDMTAPYYSGAELNESNKTTFFDDDYPNTYGYKDSVGNFVKVNKVQGTVQFQHKSSTNLRVAPDGSVQVALSNGAYFTFSNQNNFNLNIGEVEIEGTADGSLSMTAGSEVRIDSPQLVVDSKLTEFTGDVSVGTGASGSFWTFGNLVTVKNGIIVSIE